MVKNNLSSKDVVPREICEVFAFSHIFDFIAMI
jgi:hypothetical protein